MALSSAEYTENNLFWSIKNALCQLLKCVQDNQIIKQYIF